MFKSFVFFLIIPSHPRIFDTFRLNDWLSFCMCNTDIELVTFSIELQDHNEKLFSETILTETFVDSDK